MKFKQAPANLTPFTLNQRGTDSHFIERHFEAMYSSGGACNINGTNHCIMESHLDAMYSAVVA